MPLTFEEVGGIAIPYPTADERQVQQALGRLDPGLFLDKEWEPNGPHGGYAYHLVKHRVGENLVVPIAGTEWRDNHGPKPLTMAIVERVKRNEGALDGAAKWAADHNRAKAEKTRQETSEQLDEIVRDFHRHGRTGNFSGPVHRSQALRIARDRARRGKAG